jgi:KaiC/GvpD/RAD55 family RecA-like ATPase
MEFYGVKTYGEDRQEYPYPSGGIKVRKFPKEFYAKNGFRGQELFGMNLFPAGSSKMVTVVEGELDAMSAFQMLSDNRYKSPVVSLPSASPSGKLWERTKGWLDSFEKIILSVDNDEPGRKVAEVMFDLFPGKVYMMNHGQFKDANDFLQAGKQREYKSAWWSAKKYSPAGFTSGSEDWLKAVRDETPYGYTETPVEALNKVMRGWIKGGITVVKAPPGVGKTSLFRYVQHDLVKNKGKVVANLAMEEMKSTTARGMATYELGYNVNTEEDQKVNGVTDEEFEEALLGVVGDERFVSFDIDPHDPLGSTLKQCKHAITIYGADYIFIDHLQRLAYLSGVDGATSALTELGVKLVELAKRKNVGIIAISHVNNDGQTKYAKSIEEEAIVLLELQRDKLTEDQDEKNTTYLTVTKNRPFATTGPSGMLRYDVETTMVQEYSGPAEPNVEERDNGIPF